MDNVFDPEAGEAGAQRGEPGQSGAGASDSGDGPEASTTGLDPSLARISDDELTTGFDEALAWSRHADWQHLAYEAEIEARGMFRTDGVGSLRTWISMRTAEGHRSAGIHTLIARLLPGYPLLSAALHDGLISVEHVRYLTVLAALTEVGDSELVALGRRHTVSQLETACRAARRSQRRSNPETDQDRGVTWGISDNGTFLIRARLSTIDGLNVTELLSTIAEEAEPDPATGLYDPFEARCADALVELCTAPEGTPGDKPTVTIHAPLTLIDRASTPALPVDRPTRTAAAQPEIEAARKVADDIDSRGPPDLGDLGDLTGLADLTHLPGLGDLPDLTDLGDLPEVDGYGFVWPATTAGGAVIADDTLRRLLCDSRLRLTLEDTDRQPVGIGRQSRMIPRWLSEQLRWRDRTCRFPGCEHTRWLHAHHVQHWTDGGPTDIDNLLLLCGRHHRLVHEGRWHLDRNADEAFTFAGPTGRVFATSPALHPHTLGSERSKRVIAQDPSGETNPP